MKLAGISYVSPVLRYDPDAKVVIVQHRDTATGKVSRQFPSEEAVRDLRLAAITGGSPVKPVSAPPEKPRAADEELARESVSLTV